MLERNVGRYSLRELQEAIGYSGRQGAQVFVTLSTLDSERATLPGYVDGFALSSPEVLTAWNNPLEQIVPVMAKNEVWGLSMGNETDILLLNDLVSQQEVVTFYKEGHEIINRLDPDLATRITFSGDAVFSIQDTMDLLFDNVDFVTYNYAGLDCNLRAQTQANWAATLQAFKDVAEGKDIFIQDLGAPAGYDPDGDKHPKVGAAEEFQAELLSYTIDQIALDPQLRGGLVFQLFDWSPELAEAYARPLVAAGLAGLAYRIEEWLATTGMIRWDDATARPVWDGWIEGLELTEAARLDDHGNQLETGGVLGAGTAGQLGFASDVDVLLGAAPVYGSQAIEVAFAAVDAFDLSGRSIAGGSGGSDTNPEFEFEVAAADEFYLVVSSHTGENPADRQVADLENWTGTGAADAATGTDAAERFRGLKGHDGLNGGGGAVRFWAGAETTY